MQLSLWETIKLDFNGFIAKVQADLKWLKDEGTKVINWVEAESPQAKAVIAALVQSAEADAVILEQAAAKGLGGLVSTLADTMGTVIANKVAGSQLSVSAAGALTDLGVGTLSDLSQIFHAVLSTELVKAISVTAPKKPGA